MNVIEKKLTERFSKKKVTLLGAGVSNRPLVSLMLSLGASVTVRDKKSEEQLGGIGAVIKEMGAKLICGDSYLEGMTDDFIFRSPGFRPDMPCIEEAKKAGSELTSEMECFLSVVPCPVIAVTGSAGKTTTTTLISRMLEAGCKEQKSGKMFLGGNIGEPLLHRVMKMQGKDVVAVELSSFQLMSIDAQFDTAVITNITPNHLNWHTDMQEYIDAKARILNHCGRAVLNFSDANTRALGEKLDVPVTYFSKEEIPQNAISEKDRAIYVKDGYIVERVGGEETSLLSVKDILLPGMHNVENYMAAIAATRGRVSLEAIGEIAKSFGGVPHRFELVAVKNGITYYNSSIDSAPERTAAALSAAADKKIVLICGGYDKNLDYAPLADAIIDHGGVHTVVLNGGTAKIIEKELVRHPKFADAGISLIYKPAFDDAVKAASDAAMPGDLVLLSPAAASFDQFENFEKRGERFRTIVGRI